MAFTAKARQTVKLALAGRPSNATDLLDIAEAGTGTVTASTERALAIALGSRTKAQQIITDVEANQDLDNTGGGNARVLDIACADPGVGAEFNAELDG